ncbi:Bgt-50894 [Blumeria graminis f. sp. tritici]|uniref:Bgt-50894 n=1 Tax=Blumeria graminis f. sp. tritici TaxID=62690 RepID=A0A9X9QEC6_BLUGR|nr:Bgt-50894 [Blumeria graminis f. sp. tritici]
MEFMALEILTASIQEMDAVVTHTYRHDLESFFYVLVWICIRCEWTEGNFPYGAFLSKWYTGTIEEIRDAKQSKIMEDRFRAKVLAKFSPKFIIIQRLVLEP